MSEKTSRESATDVTHEDDAGAQWFVYVLECADGSYYTGITISVARRVAEHRGKGGLGARYTRTHPPVGIAAVWIATDRSDASRLEWHIKRLTRPQKEALVRGEVGCDHERVAPEELKAWWLEALGEAPA